jgi:hypothetical protein
MTDLAIASLRDMQEEAPRISPGDGRILSIRFGEPEEGGAA